MADEKMVTIGKNLKRIRCNAKMDVNAVAEKMKLTRQSIYKWEHGETLPQADRMIDLMMLYEVYDIRELIARHVKTETIK